MKTTAFFIFTICCLALGCAKDHPKPGETTWVEHGDPDSLLENNQAQSEISKTELEALVNWWPYSQQVIGPRSTLQSLQNSRQAQSQQKTVMVYPLRLTAQSDALVLHGARGDFQMVLTPLVSGRYTVQSLQGQSARLIHFSRSGQRAMINFLIRLTADGTLVALTLADEKERDDLKTKVDPSAGKYSYQTRNAGRWRENQLTISLCGFPGAEEVALAKKAMVLWQNALGDRLQLQVQVMARGCVPFSDLNMHGIYWNKGYKPHPESSDINIGTTFLIEGDSSLSLIDADVVIYASELAKQKAHDLESLRQLRRENLFFGLLHEIGHVLGLGHPSAPNVASVMANKNTQKLQPYDIQAIQALYSK